MIPPGITLRHVQKAIKSIDKDGIPAKRKSYRYYLRFNGKQYPPKLVISVAWKFIQGQEWSSKRFNAVEAKSFFVKEKYAIWDEELQRVISIPKIANERFESKNPEGNANFRRHRRLERDSRIARAAKNLRFQQVGFLSCDVCGFSFGMNYGSMGSDYIEAHHIVPISKLDGKIKTKVSDIALVCANCHRMLHRQKPEPSIEKLSEIVERNRK